MIERQIGFVNVIKPTGVTSFEVVSRVKKIFNEKHVGHLGTLDPAASGVLPIAVGKATKFFDYFLNKDKCYTALVKFGKETDTLDSFGNITNINDKIILKEDIEKVISNFVGEIEQVPPKFSAIKIDGKKAYELARKNINFEIKSRKITIFDIKLIKNCGKNLFLFQVHCSAGTYIRTLFQDIAKALETVSTTVAIIRTKSGRFKIDDAKTLDELEKSPNVDLIEKIFSDLQIIDISAKYAKKILNGVKLKLNEIDFNVDKSKEFLIKFQDKLVGLFKVENNLITPIIYVY